MPLEQIAVSRIHHVLRALSEGLGDEKVPDDDEEEATPCVDRVQIKPGLELGFVAQIVVLADAMRAIGLDFV